jgi:hypothetical protein
MGAGRIGKGHRGVAPAAAVGEGDHDHRHHQQEQVKKNMMANRASASRPIRFRIFKKLLEDRRLDLWRRRPFATPLLPKDLPPPPASAPCWGARMDNREA